MMSAARSADTRRADTRRADTRRSGYTLAEALVALLVAGLLTLCLATVLAVVGRASLRHAEITAAAETERTVAAVLGAEIRASTRADASFAGDSVRLRAFRGRGTVCGAAPGEIVVAYDGVRMPEEDKDSVLLVWADRESALDLTGALPGGACGGRSVRLLAPWTGADPSGVPLLALVFETGAYSVAGGAFRYRRGSAGRQPLTEENLSSAASGITLVVRAGGAAAARVTLRTLDSRRAPPVSWPLGMPQGARTP